MARSSEEFSIQFRVSELPTAFNTPAPAVHPLPGHQPSASTNIDLTTSIQLPKTSGAVSAAIEKVTKVPRAEYTKTSTQSSDSLAKNTIIYQSQDSEKKMAHLDSILNTKYLLTLFNGHRPSPVSSADPITGSQTIIKADDIFHYDYDL
jgi:hypothetical protein